MLPFPIKSLWDLTSGSPLDGNKDGIDEGIAGFAHLGGENGMSPFWYDTEPHVLYFFGMN